MVERGVEAHAGLDRDRELIDEVRQLRVDAVCAARRRLLEEEAGQEEPDESEEQREHDLAWAFCQ